MELEKIFVLKNKYEYKRVVNIFVKSPNGDTVKRSITFTTERLVDVKQRQANAKKIAAEYWVLNDAEADALLSSSAYGKTFVRKDDPEGLLKKPTKKISGDEAEKASLKILFDAIGLKFDNSLPLEVLKSLYKNQMQALAGVNKVEESAPAPIKAKLVNVQQDIMSGVSSAKAKFEEKHGYPVPDVVLNDIAFYDGLSNPEFDELAYIEAKTVKDEDANDDVPGEGSLEGDDKRSIEELREAYKNMYGTNVANSKKNDAEWIRRKLKEE